MPSLTYAVSLTGAGGAISSSIVRTADGIQNYAPALPPGSPGTLTTRTDATHGVATVPTGHGITTANVVDVYFAGGLLKNCTVSAVTATNVTFGGGTGTNLPVATTAIVVSAQMAIIIPIPGDELQIIGIMASFPSPTSTDPVHVDFQDTSATTVADLNLVANAPQVWDVAGGASNPFTGNPVVGGNASNGSSTASCNLNVTWAANS